MLHLMHQVLKSKYNLLFAINIGINVFLNKSAPSVKGTLVETPFITISIWNNE